MICCRVDYEISQAAGRRSEIASIQQFLQQCQKINSPHKNDPSGR
jgi:hypothetical protein